MSVVKLGKVDQRKLKSFSKAIEVIAKICRVFVYIALVAIVFLMFMIPVIMKNIEVSEDAIIVDDVSIKLADSELQVIEGGKVVSNVDISNSSENVLVFDIIKGVLDNYSKAEIVASAEFGLIVVIVSLVLYSFVFKYLAKLFGNINKEEKPFTSENAIYLRKIAYLVLWTVIVSFISSIVFGFMFNLDLSSGISLTDVIIILFLYCMAYIFEYGKNIQGKSKNVIYGETEE